ncbi:hypothetical protein [Rhizobium glycinendophyticum]|uniref:hypothetical protein n=1 Tax=Rhizobium glycinendophyticum TaxID=2589807 RepID=UPI001FEC1BA5|nr:hypothetical protein [Rhizobium glycinendophyticum]
MVEVRLSTEAEADILDNLTRTYADFGGDALLRYEFLLVTALSDLAMSTLRRGVVTRPELGSGIHSYHLRNSRDRARHST